MDDNNQNKKIVFLGDTSPIVFGMLDKYNLRETNDEAVRKIEEGKFLNAGLILDITKRTALGIISKEGLISIIENELKVSKETAEQLSKDIENELLSIAEVVSENEYEKSESTLSFPEKTPAASMERPTFVKKPKDIYVLPKKYPQGRQEKNKNYSKGPDSYRESI